jgi:hypothetical protein
MKTHATHSIRKLLTLTAVAALGACADESSVAPTPEQSSQVQMAATTGNSGDNAIATLRRVTARYHNLDAAIADGFVLLHPCEEREGEGPVGAVYAHFGRVLDGVIDPQLPDALVYEPSQNGKPKLVAVEFAQPYPFAPQAPTFMDATFQREDEFGVWALHIWVWRSNPEGMFAESNPRVSCDAE